MNSKGDYDAFLEPEETAEALSDLLAVIQGRLKRLKDSSDAEFDRMHIVIDNCEYLQRGASGEQNLDVLTAVVGFGRTINVSVTLRTSDTSTLPDGSIPLGLIGDAVLRDHIEAQHGAAFPVITLERAGQGITS